MIINGYEFPNPDLGDGEKSGAATYETTSITGKVRTYVRTFSRGRTYTFSKLTPWQYQYLLELASGVLVIDGVSWQVINNPLEGKEEKDFWSLTINLRQV